MRYHPLVHLVTSAILVAAQNEASEEIDLGLINASDNTTDALGWWDHGYGEPLNAIISNKSHPSLLTSLSSWSKPSFNHYFLAHYLSDECLGQSGPNKMLADLHDGRGMQPEVGLKRWTYEDDYLGTCIQTFDGGLHFRYFVQNTSHSQVTRESATGGAIFLAVSEEHDLTKNHDIVFDGYNLGRDYLVGNLTQQRIETKASGLNSSTGSLDRVTVIDPSIEYQGTKVFEGITYKTSVRYHAGLARNTSDKINHEAKVTTPGIPAVDGWVAVITIDVDEGQTG
ncbi:hypothetical protein HD553DRAFT_346047 [Filobasidium floriforme]|uniref:uncharacterized protein n=1 Tax=Filobasidium floriforme TaxID=5210 RepID=UPI001E8E5503|nr:uncharacterized protein HD553DRAFT_346047 [Filobasidium floriforme]KAH8078663.1 hypothetical protein HD553DRAFT_346047 [Filobasidium floriforme]